MDEYLFTVLAKLKADRLKVERQEQQQKAAEDVIETPVHRSPRARRSVTTSADWRSIVSTHGLRGWS
jgi:hypothetical protein